MKNRFAAYYELPESRIKEIWADSLIVFDTNALLNLYRYNKATREEFIRLLKSYKSRLWLPYQVGKEFHCNRKTVIKETYEAYQKLNEELKTAIESAAKGKIDTYARLQYIDKSKLQEAVQKCMEAISKDLTKQQEKHPDLSEKDTILETITKLYDGKIGEDFSMDALNTLYVEGEKRYAHSIPPGYCDAKSKKGAGNRALYGDLIVWAQTLHKCKQDGRNVIFITNDYKSDWWDTVKGEHSPRKELIQEFMDYTGKNILVYDSVRFLTYAQKYEKADVSQATIDEVEKSELWPSFIPLNLPTFDYAIPRLDYPALGLPSEFYTLYDDIVSPDYTSQLRKIYGNIIPPSLDEFKHFVNQMGGLDVVKQMTERLEQSRWWERWPMMQTPSKDANNESNTTEQ